MYAKCFSYGDEFTLGISHFLITTLTSSFSCSFFFSCWVGLQLPLAVRAQCVFTPTTDYGKALNIRGHLSFYAATLGDVRRSPRHPHRLFLPLRLTTGFRCA
jgi:hypothetical protein